MKEGIIAILEGTSCVGKTTLCERLKQEEGWVILPEAIRYLEQETGKKGDEASPIPGSQEEEEYYQDKLFQIEMQKLIEANRLRREGKNVVMDKSAIATVATAKAFEKLKGFNDTFRRAYLKYAELVHELNKQGMTECDIFLLLTADYETICKRNIGRNHVLNGIWIDEETIKMQRSVLERMTREIIGSVGSEIARKEIIDTTNLTKDEVLQRFNKIIRSIPDREEERG